jgi:hypothetical protein
MTCDTCNRLWPADRFSPESLSPNTCFKCRAGSIGVAYLAYPQGRQEFKGATIKERQDRELKEAKKAGMNVRLKRNVYSGGVGAAFSG